MIDKTAEDLEMLRVKTINDDDTDDDDNGELYEIYSNVFDVSDDNFVDESDNVICYCWTLSSVFSVSFCIEKCLIFDVLFKIRHFFIEDKQCEDLFLIAWQNKFQFLFISYRLM